MLLKIKSKYIINEIFKYMKTTTKFKIIKYNKQMLNILNVTKEDFEKLFTLQEFNKKYKLNIKDTYTESLNIIHNTIGNEGLEYLSKLKFKRLKNINFWWVGTLNINILEKFNLKNLEILKLCFNGISDIKVLEKLDCKNLKELFLDGGFISDINVFEKVNFKELKTLSLYSNEISDINVLAG